LRQIYSDEKIKPLVDAIEEKNQPFVIVWITGFKPKGDDSRPDRGLVPLARMLFGNDIDILTIVFGPAGKGTWKTFIKNPATLGLENGLWQAVLGLSNYILADSATSPTDVLIHSINRDLERKSIKVIFNSAKENTVYGEHDVDTAIHTLFSRQSELNIFESMCNPPGGDWSGISFSDFLLNSEHRWTSLPRVSATRAKRPDHIIQIHTEKQQIFLVIESKNNARDLDDNIGERLTEYIKVLFKIAPTAHKEVEKDWKLFSGSVSPLLDFLAFSGGAFCYKSFDEMKEALEEGKLDFVFAFEFKNDGGQTIGHLLLSEQAEFLSDIFLNVSIQFSGRFKIKIY
jgi:hypothetical protein